LEYYYLQLRVECSSFLNFHIVYLLCIRSVVCLYLFIYFFLIYLFYVGSMYSVYFSYALKIRLGGWVVGWHSARGINWRFNVHLETFNATVTQQLANHADPSIQHMLINTFQFFLTS
jgi:hypothetical protein